MEKKTSVETTYLLHFILYYVYFIRYTYYKSAAVGHRREFVIERVCTH